MQKRLKDCWVVGGCRRQVRSAAYAAREREREREREEI